MLAYYISQSNEYTFRTLPTASSAFTMSLQDMTTLQNVTMSMSGTTFAGYESFVSFTGSINNVQEGAEYRAVLYNGTSTGSLDVWHGTIQVYASQSTDKSDYENKIPPIISHESENRYIILN